jgi:hypothetical protein
VTPQPRNDVATVLSHAVGVLRKQSKLVVLTATVSADVEKTSDKKLWGVDLGATTVLVRAPGQVQYYVPLDGITSDNLEYHLAQKTLIVRASEPIVDPGMVCVDPAKIEVWKQIGWARLERFSGRYLESLARRELCDQMIAAGNQEILREKARQQARAALTNLLEPVVASLGADMGLEVQLVPWEGSR